MARTLFRPNDQATATLRPPLHHALTSPVASLLGSARLGPLADTLLHRPSSLYGNGFGNGPQLGSGRLGPEDVLVTPTGADLELVNGADSDQITPTYLLDANGYNVRVGPYPKTGEQVPVLQVLRCPTLTPRRAPQAP